MRGMRTPWRAAVAAPVLTALLAVAGPAAASDHADTTVLDSEASVDIADVFAWVSTATTARDVYLGMTLRARPAAGVQYVFHLDNRATLTEPGVTSTAMCVFAIDTDVECWWGDTGYVAGRATTGIVGLDLAAWTDYVDDPTFADAIGLEEFVAGTMRTKSATVACAAPSQQIRSGLLADLAAATYDDFEGGQVFLILLRAPAEVVTPNGPLLGVWASTRGVQ